MIKNTKIFISLIATLSISFLLIACTKSKPVVQSTTPETIIKNQILDKNELILSFAGDCTLGTDENFDYTSSLPAIYIKKGNDFSYFLKNVSSIFKNDDISIVNLETTLTDAKEKADKGKGTVYHFKGPKDFVNILTSSGVDGASVSNNHIYDYKKKGFDDTISILKNANIGYFGEGYKFVKEVKGLKIGFLAYQGFNDSTEIRNKIKTDILQLKNNCDIIIPYFHWGVENSYTSNSTQINLAHFSIDNGADFVVGSHPHVIEGLETYKGKLIAYSFGNFCFGGNQNPGDKNTFILQIKLNFISKKLTDKSFKVIPCSISSVSSFNDYCPTILANEGKSDILNKLNKLSPTLNNKISDNFTSLN